MSAPADMHAGTKVSEDPSLDPLVRARLGFNRARMISGCCILAVLIWACWPLAPTQIASPETIDRTPVKAAVPLAPINLAAFDAPLWTVAAAPVPEIAPAPAPPPPPPLPTLRLQLLGIMREGTDSLPVYRAAIYEPDSDKIFVVASGDTVGGRIVQSITPDRIALALGKTVQTLLLRPDQATADGKGGP